jgi:hypothetical protein
MFGKAAFGLLKTVTNIEWKPDRNCGKMRGIVL